MTVEYTQKKFNHTTLLSKENFMLAFKIENIILRKNFEKYFQIQMNNWSYDYQKDLQIDNIYLNFEKCTKAHFYVMTDDQFNQINLKDSFCIPLNYSASL